MKTYIFLLVLLNALPLGAQVIQNNGFETWDYYNSWTLEPLGWNTPNNQLVMSVVQDSMAFEGELAMRVTVLPGFEGGIQQTANTTIYTIDSPTFLHFAVKANVPESDIYDNVSITLEYRAQGNTAHTETWSSFESIPDWQVLDWQLPAVDINFDEIRIHVTSGYSNGLNGGSWETWISVDELQVDFVIDVPKYENFPVLMYPNPCSSNLFIQTENRAGLVCRIYDVTGNVIYTERLHSPIDMSGFDSGAYHVMILDEKGEILADKVILK